MHFAMEYIEAEFLRSLARERRQKPEVSPVEMATLAERAEKEVGAKMLADIGLRIALAVRRITKPGEPVPPEAAGLRQDETTAAIDQLLTGLSRLCASPAQRQSSPADEDGVLLRYAGTWRRDRTYQSGAAVTEGGTLWFATEGVAEGERPGRSSKWQLMVKSGHPSAKARAR